MKTAVLSPEWVALHERLPGEVTALDAGRTYTTDEVADAAWAVSVQLRDAGVEPGDRVVVALPSSVRFVVVYLAIRLCGGVLVNLPWQWRREILQVVEETEARAVVLDERVDAAVVRELGSIVVVPADADGGSRSAFPGPAFGPARRPDDVAWIAYSSGTTARPKGAVHTEETLALIAHGFVERYGLDRDDVVLVAAPVGHAVGFVYGVELALRARCGMVLMHTWDGAACADLIARHGCTFVAAPTPFLLDLVDVAERNGPHEFASLRIFLCGGASVPTPLLERARASLPQTDVTAYYGTSECGGVATCPPDAPLEKKLTTDGKPLAGMRVRVERGELLVCGAQMARRYWRGGEPHRFRRDGWFATGDEATLDAEGYIRIGGRLDDRIVRGGVNVSPLEVELVLSELPGVREVAVIGSPDPRLGERIMAVVVAAGEEPVTLEALVDHCREAGLAKAKWPELLRAVPELPRTPSGKLLRGMIKQELAGA